MNKQIMKLQTWCMCLLILCVGVIATSWTVENAHERRIIKLEHELEAYQKKPPVSNYQLKVYPQIQVILHPGLPTWSGK